MNEIIVSAYVVSS